MPAALLAREEQMRRILGGFLGWLLCAVAAGAALADTVGVTFLLTNDIYKIDGGAPRGGFARLNAVVKAERAKGGYVIYAHAGDLISPSLFSGFDKGEHTIVLTNMAPPDIFTPGNHEYDFGPDIFAKRMKEAKFPILAANLQGPDGKPLAGIGDVKFAEFGKLKIGLVGLTADDSPVKSSPGNLKFLPTVDTAIAKAAELRKAGADFTVAVIHANRAEDRELFDSRAFDLILTGDDHDLFVMFDGRTAMVESREEADFVTAIDVNFDIEEKDGRKTVKWFPNFRIIDTATIAPDPETQAKVDAYNAELSKELDVVIGKTSAALDSRRATVRSEEAAIGNLVADAMRDAVKADIAITNGGGIRGNKEYPAGASLSRRDVLTELPFGNRTVKIAVSGETILAALENGVSEVENAAGRFPQVSGLTFEYDPAKPKGSRVLSVSAGGKPLDRASTYTLATNDYMANGGDSYVMFKGAKTLYGVRDAKLMANDVMAYITARGEVAPAVEGRIRRK
jgi:2',3'-cyclic-nucleotide 2'-phosphodiesterase (5'-nucleotidase family)